jgi:hypothetical protein
MQSSMKRVLGDRAGVNIDAFDELPDCLLVSLSDCLYE